MLTGTLIGRRHVRPMTLADSPTLATEAAMRGSGSNGARMIAKRYTRLAAGPDECRFEPANEAERASTGKVAVRPQAAMHLRSRPQSTTALSVCGACRSRPRSQASSGLPHCRYQRG